MRRGRGQRGATIVEAAIVLPTLIALMFGLLEMGLYFKDSLTLDEAVKDGAHIGALYAQDSSADYQMVQKILHASLNGTVQEIIIYDAANPDPNNPAVEAPSASCLASSTGVQVGYTDAAGLVHATGAIGSCNVYLASNGDFTQPLSCFQGGCGAWTNSQNWPGTIRLQNTTDVRYKTGTNQQAGPGPDLIGVWVKTTHNWTTGIVETQPSTLTSQAVFRIEPRQ